MSKSSSASGDSFEGMTEAQEQAHELAAANRILAHRGVLDAYGHVSVRDTADPDRFLLARSMAPALVTAADIQRYDLDGETDGPARSYLERFIHAAVYRARPDVQAIVHSHSQSVVPFGIVRQPLQAVWHMAGFLGPAVPVFDIRDVAGDGTDLLVSDQGLGQALAERLGDGAAVLMRGHGSVVVGDSLRVVVQRAVYTELNARVQWQAMQLGEHVALSPAEGVAAGVANDGQVSRSWEVWLRELPA